MHAWHNVYTSRTICGPTGQTNQPRPVGQPSQPSSPGQPEQKIYFEQESFSCLSERSDDHQVHLSSSHQASTLDLPGLQGQPGSPSQAQAALDLEPGERHHMVGQQYAPGPQYSPTQPSIGRCTPQLVDTRQTEVGLKLGIFITNFG